jgi:glycosyltransferase involved in cell wall biosynthesis
MPSVKPTLFITYDGLLDDLGQSQILPYVLELAAHPRWIHILSFEKQSRIKAGEVALRSRLGSHTVTWTPLTFTRRFSKLGKTWDLLRMYVIGLLLVVQHNVGVVHCRSYQAMQVGSLLKRLFGVRIIFDMRGLWVDERVDGGLWPQDRLVNRLAYRLYKHVETALLASADHVVVLTNAVVPELQRLCPGMEAPVTVIPCCADFEHFTVPLNGKERLRERLGIASDDLVLSYLGSLGTWYLLEDMLLMFSLALRFHGNVHLLLVTRDWSPEHEMLIDRLQLRDVRNLIHVQPGTREEVPELIGSSDVMISFIKPGYSKIASSPTKLAEAFALGIPVVSNAGIGDVERVTLNLDAGALVDLEDPKDLLRVTLNLNNIRAKGGDRLRCAARKLFGLEIATASYRAVYRAIET